MAYVNAQDRAGHGNGVYIWLRMRLHRNLPRIVALAIGIDLGMACHSARAQDKPPGAQLTFDAASVRIHIDSPAAPPAGWHGGPGTSDPGQITYGNVPLASLLQDAFRVRLNRIGPESMTQTGERYDVVAKIPPGATVQQMGVMLQNLLKERFHMVAHRETKEEPVYELVVGKNGSKLLAAQSAPAPLPSGATPYRPPAVDQEGFPQIPAGQQMLLQRPLPDGGVRLAGQMQPISNLAATIEGVVERPIIDKTGLAGRYDFKLAFSRALTAVAPNSDTEPADNSPIIFDALQDQLGLRLQPARAMVERVVIDHIDKTPSDN